MARAPRGRPPSDCKWEAAIGWVDTITDPTLKECMQDGGTRGTVSFACDVSLLEGLASEAAARADDGGADESADHDGSGSAASEDEDADDESGADDERADEGGADESAASWSGSDRLSWRGDADDLELDGSSDDGERAPKQLAKQSAKQSAKQRARQPKRRRVAVSSSEGSGDDGA